MLTAPLEIMARNAKRSPEVVRAWNAVTEMKITGHGVSGNTDLRNTGLENLTHRQAYLMAREAIFKRNKRGYRHLSTQ